MPKINYIEWGRLGVVMGVVWGAVITALNFAFPLTGYLDAPSRVMAGSTLSLTFMVWMALAGLAQYSLGRSVFGVISWQNKKPYWKLVQVGLVGVVLLDVLALFVLNAFSNMGFVAMTLGAGFLNAVVSPRIAAVIYKKLGWQLPDQISPQSV
jgi:hypothetical protein